MVVIEDIMQFLQKYSFDNKIVTSESDIFHDFGLTGDDCGEFLYAYQKTFNVDMTNYLWYFHHDEESKWTSIGGYFLNHQAKELVELQ